MLKHFAMFLRSSIKLIVLIIASIILITAAITIFYKPTYEVSLNGELIGYTSDKSNLQERINKYVESGNGEDVVFAQIDSMPQYKLCLLKKNVETNDDEIYEKVTSNGTEYYRFYAITDDKEEKYYVSTFQEAEDIVKQLKEKNSANKDDIGILEKYDKTKKELTNVETCVTKLYEKVVPKVTYVASTKSSSSSSVPSGGSSSYVSLGVTLQAPLVGGTITSRFGSRESIRSSPHRGMDIAAPYGTSIKAAASGTVTLSGWNGSYGYCVKISHGNGTETVYGHCSSLLVSVGQKVSKGQVIARVGSTGNSTGNHLHFEVRKNGVLYNPQNYVY